MSKDLKILIIGGDPALSVALSTLHARPMQISLKEGGDAERLEMSTRDIDVIVIVSSNNEEADAPLRAIRHIGLQRGTVIIAEPDDRRTAAEALAVGIGGYLVRGATSAQLATAIKQVAEKGITYQAPAADVLHRMIEASGASRGIMSAMNAARALASALELKDTYTGGHAERVASLAMRLSERADLPGAMPEEPLEAAFLLHDVGKIGIPESILNKAGSLTDTERRVLQTHPILGERIVQPLGFPVVVGQVIRHHHERWDGRGYPDALIAEDIPPAARLFAIADAIDAMTSMRPYRRPMTFEEAVQEVLENAGTQFDPFLCQIVEETFLEGPIQLQETL